MMAKDETIKIKLKATDEFSGLSKNKEVDMVYSISPYGTMTITRKYKLVGPMKAPLNEVVLSVAFTGRIVGKI